MESIISRFQTAILKPVPAMEFGPLPGKMTGRLRITPEELLVAIEAQTLAEWALSCSSRLQPPRLKKGPGGRPTQYQETSILLMAVVQTVWRKSYEQIVRFAPRITSWPSRLVFKGAPSLRDSTGNGERGWGCCPSCFSSWLWLPSCCGSVSCAAKN